MRKLLTITIIPLALVFSTAAITAMPTLEAHAGMWGKVKKVAKKVTGQKSPSSSSGKKQNSTTKQIAVKPGTSPQEITARKEEAERRARAEAERVKKEAEAKAKKEVKKKKKSFLSNLSSLKDSAVGAGKSVGSSAKKHVITGGKAVAVGVGTGVAAGALVGAAPAVAVGAAAAGGYMYYDSKKKSKTTKAKVRTKRQAKVSKAPKRRSTPARIAHALRLR